MGVFLMASANGVKFCELELVQRSWMIKNDSGVPEKVQYGLRKFPHRGQIAFLSKLSLSFPGRRN